jgi:hypothetical protein
MKNENSALHVDLIACEEMHRAVIPAKAGIQGVLAMPHTPRWIPAFAGMTARAGSLANMHTIRIHLLTSSQISNLKSSSLQPRWTVQAV